MKITNWKNAYPINTFTGKTQMELIGFIESLLQTNDDAWRSKVLELKAILEKNKDEPVTGNVVLLELNNIFIDLKEKK